MRPRVLVTGVGSVLRGDEGFGLEVVQRLAETRLPAWVQLADHGIGSGRLHRDMLGSYDTTVLLDGTPCGGQPGRLTVTDLDLDPGADSGETSTASGLLAPHGFTPEGALTWLRLLGGDAARLVLVSCEPVTHTGARLSPPVSAAADAAVRLLTGLVWGEPSAPATPSAGESLRHAGSSLGY